MKNLFLFMILFVFCISTACAIEADIKCPDEINVNEEFECNVNVENFTGSYDLKIELTDGGENIAQIFDISSDKWKSAYYYLTGFIDEGDAGSDKEVKLKITGQVDGDINGLLKLRQDSKITSFDFEIGVFGGGGDSVDEDNEEKEDVGEVDEEDETNNNQEDENTENEESTEQNENIINLNPQHENKQNTQTSGDSDGEVVYESKDEKIRKYAIYGFAFFLILIIVFLLIRR
jgi:hypothetical protein